MARRKNNKLKHSNLELKEKNFKREVETKKKVTDILIACEDSVSSPTYFKKIVQDLIDKRIITQDSFVIAKHKHTNPTGVLDDLIHYKQNKFGKTYEDFENKWIIIDRDTERVNGSGHTAKDFNEAISKSKAFNVNVAYANDSFELWYLLHFDYRDTAISRDKILEEVIKKLKAKNPKEFSKLTNRNIKNEEFSKKIFDELLSEQKKAIKFSKKLLASYGSGHNPEKDNPSTTIHKLVELLNNL
jgi:hypothetical protein